MAADPGTKRVSDPKAWLAIAHPLRIDILLVLSSVDAARPADIAARLHVPANKVSFHLRQLERFDYVERANDVGNDRRESWWRTTAHAGFQMHTEEAPDEQAREAAQVMAGSLQSHAHRYVDQWFADALTPDERWDGESPRRANFELRMRLTPDEFEQMTEEIDEVISGWRDVGLRQESDDAVDVTGVAFLQTQARRTEA